MLPILMAESELFLCDNAGSSSSGDSSSSEDRHRRSLVNPVVNQERATPEVGERERVGRYEIRERIGAGGMGVVYAAWDPELDRRVALKFIRPGHAVSPELLARRLRREAQAMARLRHDNVVAVYDFGGSADGQLFVAMEYVDGVSLRKWLRAKTRSVVEILSVFRAAGEGLAAAHAEGLIHRDFKPDNVLVANDGKALVLDFGLASWVTSPGSDPGEPSGATPITPSEASPWPSSSAGSGDLNETSLTKPGAVLGTPNYMAPEQRRGLTIDARSDQFAFCVALWQALTGELPYGRGSSRALARTRVGKLGKLQRKDVPAHVERALRRGLAWAPEHRWPDMRALLDALEITSRRRWWWLAVPAALAVVVGGAALSMIDGETPGSCDEQSERLSTVWNTTISDGLATTFSTRGELARHSWPFVRNELERWSESWTAVDLELCERYGQAVTPELYQQQLLCLDRARDRFGLAISLLGNATTEELEHSFDLLARLPDPSACREAPSDARPGADRERLAKLERAADELELELELGRFESAVTSSVALFEATSAPGFEHLHMRAVELRSNVLVELERREEAVDVAFSGLAAAERDGTAELRLRAFSTLASAHLHTQDLQAAERFLAQAKAIAAEPNVDPALQRDLALAEGWIVGVGGRPDLAVVAFERALTFIDPSTDLLGHANTTVSRAHMLGYLGRAKEALEQLVLAERELMQFVGPHHPMVFDLRLTKGSIQMHLADWTAARKELLEASAALEALRGGPTTDTLGSRAKAAWALDQLGDCQGAMAEYEPIIDLAREQMPYPGPDLGDVLNRRATICDHRSPEAVDFAREALTLYRAAVGDEHVMVASAHSRLAQTLYEAGKLEPALEEVDTALAIHAAIHPIGSEFVDVTQALRVLIRHALGQPGALDGLSELLAKLSTSHPLAQRLAALR
jgi:serine/threonine protein kinase/tetratricopeptide (TPR) repeat protein